MLPSPRPHRRLPPSTRYTARPSAGSGWEVYDTICERVAQRKQTENAARTAAKRMNA